MEHFVQREQIVEVEKVSFLLFEFEFMSGGCVL